MMTSIETPRRRRRGTRALRALLGTIAAFCAVVCVLATFLPTQSGQPGPVCFLGLVIALAGLAASAERP